MEPQMRTFDTHKYIKELTKSGFKEAQAEVLVKSLLESREYDFSTLATREQLTALEEKLQRSISDVKYDLLKWMIPFYLTIIGLIVTILFRMLSH